VLRRRLAEELGLSVSSDVADLERRILRGEALEPVGRGRAGVRAPVVESVPFVARLPFVAGLPFVGRDAEVESILGVVGGPSRGAAPVSGVGGMGKSRLLREVAMRSTAPVLAARAFRPERDEPWGLASPAPRGAVAGLHRRRSHSRSGGGEPRRHPSRAGGAAVDPERGPGR
jgi:hypothetical protein